MTTEEYTVFASVHTHLALRLKGEWEGKEEERKRREGGKEGDERRDIRG